MRQGKNFPLTPAAMDLGLGDQLKSQLEDEVDDRKKKLLQSGRLSDMGLAARNLLGTAGGIGI